MPAHEYDSSSSSDGDGSEKDPFADPPTDGLIVPSPLSLSASDDDASPSQYQKERMAAMHSRHKSDNDGTEDDGEADQFQEESEQESEHEHRPKSRSGPTDQSDQMYSHFINMARQFTEMVEDTRKQSLMSRKSAKHSLDFSSPPKPSKYRHQKFTPPRNAREVISATQYDDDEDIERDSLTSSQTGSTRIRLQERWRIIGIKNKTTESPEAIKQWIEDHALAEMTKAGNYEDLRPVPTDVGGFKRAHVSYCIIRYFLLLFLF